MSAHFALRAARAAGVSVSVDGDDIVWQASAAPPLNVLDALSRHKAEVIVLIRPAKDEWTAEDWQAFFDESAGIAEFDGELSRPQAEAQAFESCVVEWLKRNPERGVPGRCPSCGAVEHSSDPLLPIGTKTSHVWMHSGCWRRWFKARQAKAVAALSMLGIVNRRGENAYGS
jgi:hypothetical protein